jgi:hypothetical protein
MRSAASVSFTQRIKVVGKALHESYSCDEKSRVAGLLHCMQHCRTVGITSSAKRQFTGTDHVGLSFFFIMMLWTGVSVVGFLGERWNEGYMSLLDIANAFACSCCFQDHRGHAQPNAASRLDCRTK